MTQQSRPSTMESRNLQNLMDLLNHEAVDYKKARSFSAHIKDADAKRVVDDISAHHKQSFDTLNQYLNNPLM